MEAKPKPPVGRMLAVTIAFALIGVTAFVVNSFTGNPISAFVAGRQMTRFVRQTYPQKALNLSQATYNFKTASYSLQASSPTSPDTHFRVTRTRDGRIVDSYPDDVLSGFNTIDRLGRQMTQEIRPLLADLFGTELSGRCFADLFGKQKELPQLPLDTPFSHQIMIPVAIYLDFDVTNPTLDDAAAKLQKVDDLLRREGFTIGHYIVDIRRLDTKQGYSIQVASELISGNLAKALQGALDSGSYDEKLWVSRR